MLAEQHPDHEKRIETLADYNVLDSLNEADFDDIAELASKICDAPVSLISLVDDDRQWFKSNIGFDETQTPLSQSVCSHAILQDDLLEIEDMSKDARTMDNTIHTSGPKAQFYAGANLVAPNGLPIGTLCVLDTKPRKLTEFQRQALRTLSRQVVTQLELRKKLAQETAMRSEMDHRVRNSLQTISSVMRAASREVTDPAALNVLSLVERRLGAVASLHTELMGREGQSSVNAKTYLGRVGELLNDVSPDQITVTTVAPDADIDARKASALGMIISEFAANSIKHAFPGGRVGKVEIALKNPEGRAWHLSCRDDGVGERASKSDKADDTDQDGGLGEMLMSSAAMQLEGHLDQSSGPEGTTLSVHFTN